MEFLNKYRIQIFLLSVACLNLLVFYLAFGFHPNNDTESYIISIKFFRGNGSEIFPNRYLNPFYSVVASSVFSFLSPANAIIILNIIFYFGLILLNFDLVRRVFKDNQIAFVSSLFLMTSYAMLRYSLTQVQDIGGYFWYLFIAYVSWRWYEDKKDSWLYLGGIGVSFGMLTKESGCMTALFFAALLMASRLNWRQKAMDFLKFSCLPFFTLLINQWRGADMAYNSRDWFIGNWITYAAGNYNFIKWLGVNISTYNFTWFLFALGAYYFVKNYRTVSGEIKIYFFAILIPSLSYFAWPIFISRTVFISAWFVLPLAAYGVVRLLKSGAKRKIVSVGLVTCAIAVPYFLQGTLRYAHVFKIYDDCNKKIICSWNYFWQNRNSFSKEL